MNNSIYEYDMLKNISDDNDPAGPLFSGGSYAEADIANLGTEQQNAGPLSTSCVNKTGVKPCI